MSIAGSLKPNEAQGFQATASGREASVVGAFDQKEQLRKNLLRNVLRMTQVELAAAWGTSQPFVARLMAARGESRETRSAERELDFVGRVNMRCGRWYTHADLWPRCRDHAKNPASRRAAMDEEEVEKVPMPLP